MDAGSAGAVPSREGPGAGGAGAGGLVIEDQMVAVSAAGYRLRSMLFVVGSEMSCQQAVEVLDGLPAALAELDGAVGGPGCLWASMAPAACLAAYEDLVRGLDYRAKAGWCEDVWHSLYTLSLWLHEHGGPDEWRGGVAELCLMLGALEPGVVAPGGAVLWDRAARLARRVGVVDTRMSLPDLRCGPMVAGSWPFLVGLVGLLPLSLADRLGDAMCLVGARVSAYGSRVVGEG